MDLQYVMKVLTKNGISTSIKYNLEKEQFFLDLETQAKSDLHLYDDGILRGRYKYEKQIDLFQDIEDLIVELCHEFNNALCGRNYFQSGWGELCASKCIPLQINTY